MLPFWFARAAISLFNRYAVEENCVWSRILTRSLTILDATNYKPERTMKTSFYLAGGVCAASLAFCMLLNAQPSPTTTASPAASPPTSPSRQPVTRPLPFRGKITAVDQNAKTFTVGPMVKGWESLPLKVTDSTKIMKAGAPGDDVGHRPK
jgi:hypothetical protein